MRPRVPVAVAVAILAGAVLFLVGPLRSRSAPVRYRTAPVTRGEIQSRVSVTGTLNPVDQVEVGSQVSGTIQRINVDFNSKVREGEVLAQIDPSFFRAQKSQAEATLEKAKVAARDAERALQRAKELKSKGLVSQADLDAAETTHQSRLADIREAEAQLELAKVNLEHTTIIAPIGGIVISRSVDVGQTVAASLQAPRLFQIARDLSDMQLEARVDEADIGQVREGQPVSFTVDSYPDQTFEGGVFQVRAQPIVESGVVSYTVVVRVRNPRNELLPGMTANATVVTAERADVLRIPNAALRYRPKSDAGERRERGAAAVTGAPRKRGGRGGDARGSDGGPGGDGGGKTVWVLGKGGAPKAERVRIGISDGTLVELVWGAIHEGDEVVVGEAEKNSKPGAAPATNPLGGAPPRGGRRMGF